MPFQRPQQFPHRPIIRNWIRHRLHTQKQKMASVIGGNLATTIENCVFLHFVFEVVHAIAVGFSHVDESSAHRVAICVFDVSLRNGWFGWCAGRGDRFAVL